MKNKDIETRDDIIQLVDRFYDKVVVNPVIGPFFQAIDFAHHKPLMVDFWCFVLLDHSGYKTDVTAKHIHMRLGEQHFNTWLSLFEETLNELYSGEKATLALQRANVVGWSIKAKIDAKNGN